MGILNKAAGFKPAPGDAVQAPRSRAGVTNAPAIPSERAAPPGRAVAAAAHARNTARQAARPVAPAPPSKPRITLAQKTVDGAKKKGSLVGFKLR